MNPSDMESAIVTCLESGAKTAGELLDFCHCDSYPALYAAIKHLQDQGKIAPIFSNGCLQYHLLQRRSDRPTNTPFFLAWQQQEPQSRFLWNNPAK